MGFEAVMMAGALIIGAGSAAYQGYVANDNAIDAKKAAEAAAAREQEAAARDAQAIQDKAGRLKGMQRAALAGAGAALSSGTSDAILGETDRLSAQDALAAIRDGNTRAQAIREQGNLTAGNYEGQAIASALGGVSNLLGGITTYNKATEAGRTASKIDQDTNTLLASRSTSTPKYSLLGGGPTP